MQIFDICMCSISLIKVNNVLFNGNIKITTKNSRQILKYFFQFNTKAESETLAYYAKVKFDPFTLVMRV